MSKSSVLLNPFRKILCSNYQKTSLKIYLKFWIKSVRFSPLSKFSFLRRR